MRTFCQKITKGLLFPEDVAIGSAFDNIITFCEKWSQQPTRVVNKQSKVKYASLR
jgi:hypothetical protein